MNKLLLTVLSLLTIVSCTGTKETDQKDDKPSPVKARYMTVTEDGVILDANGVPFVGRGVNLQYGDNATKRVHAIDPMASVGGNIVRLQFRDYTTAAQVEEGMRKIIANKMIVMPFYWEDGLHGGTGPTCSNDPNALRMATNKWATDWREVMQKPEYQQYILLNIANEWGRVWDNDANGHVMTYDEFTDYYIESVKAMRKAGYKMPLVIDAPQCGQDHRAFLDGRARRIYDSDPEKSIIFSIHAYWSYRTPEEIDRALAALEAEKIAYVFGEYGNNKFQSTMEGGRATDFQHLLKRLEELQKGWMAWSWFGNGDWEYQTSLDMSFEANAVKLTPHGEDVVNGPHGLVKTTKRATYWK